MKKCDTVDFTTNTETANKECKRFKISPSMDAQFYWYICVWFEVPDDAEIRTRILSKIEQNPDITLQQVPMECQRLVYLKQDSHMVQQ